MFAFCVPTCDVLSDKEFRISTKMTCERIVWVQFEGSEVCKVIVKDDADINDLKKAAIEEEKYSIGPGNVELFKDKEKPNVGRLVKLEMVDCWGTVEKPFLLHIKTGM